MFDFRFILEEEASSIAEDIKDFFSSTYGVDIASPFESEALKEDAKLLIKSLYTHTLEENEENMKKLQEKKYILQALQWLDLSHEEHNIFAVPEAEVIFEKLENAFEVAYNILSPLYEEEGKMFFYTLQENSEAYEAFKELATEEELEALKEAEEAYSSLKA